MSPLAFYLLGLFTPLILLATALAVLWPIEYVQRWHWRRTLRPVEDEFGQDWFWKDGQKTYITRFP